MKKFNQPAVYCFLFILFAGAIPAEAQVLKKLKKAAERTVERKLEEKTVRETSKVMDSVLNPGSGKTNGSNDRNRPSATGSQQGIGNQNADNSGMADNEAAGSPESAKQAMKIYSASDWVAGKNLFLFDDFSSDEIGDFPKLWNTNSTGEIVTHSDSEYKWLKLYDDGTYQPDLPRKLPEDFTIEFDLKGWGLDEETAFSSYFTIYLTDGARPLAQGRSYVQTTFPAYQRNRRDLNVYAYIDGQRQASGNLSFDIRKKMAEGTHFSISVKGQRFRLYMDGEKMIDYPRAIQPGTIQGLLFKTAGLRNGKDHLLITNLRIAEGLPGSSEKLFTTGKFVTDAIQFDVNSSQLKPESYPTLRQIANGLKSETEKKVLIVGHTDSDGEDAYNLDLSKKRAEAVKTILKEEFGISPDRMTTDGKGEAQPVAANDSPLNKAKNRRTEFILQ